MTAYRDPWIGCDVQRPGCEQQYPEDAGNDAFTDCTIPEVRRAARQDGWRFSRGSDICPSCRASASIRS